MTDYYTKYLKYKSKYLELKNNNMIGGGKKILDIDHVMFPVYNNNKFLDEVANEYKKIKNIFIQLENNNEVIKEFIYILKIFI